MAWAYDDPRERERVAYEYYLMLHQKFIEEHPEYIPFCPCHQMTAEARLWLKKQMEDPLGVIEKLI